MVFRGIIWFDVALLGVSWRGVTWRDAVPIGVARLAAMSFRHVQLPESFLVML
jgi:hypothetical protein